MHYVYAQLRLVNPQIYYLQSVARDRAPTGFLELSVLNFVNNLNKYKLITKARKFQEQPESPHKLRFKRVLIN